MGREAKFRGTFGLSPQPVAGVTLYQDKNTTAKPLEEVIEETEKGEVLSARKDVLVTKLRQKETAIRNPKRFNVDPETGRIDIDEEGGQFTQGEAAMVSASIKGKSGQYDAAIALINAAKELVSSNQPAITERPKEYLVDPETGGITRDPENGEYTLSEARTISYSIQKGKQPESPQGQKSFIEKLDQMTEGLISQRLAGMFKGDGQPVPKDPVDEMLNRIDQLDKLRGKFAPAQGSDLRTLAQSGIHGELLKLLMEDERARLQMQYDHESQVERNKQLGGLASVVKENMGDGVRALMLAADEARKGGTGATPKPQPQAQVPQPQSHECANCNNRFGIPTVEGWTVVGCPHCGAEYSREQVLGGA